MTRFACWPASLAIVALLAACCAAEEKLGYNRSIRPILAENCFACHGPDSASRKAELRLDRREAAIEGEVIVPGKPHESELVTRINATDPEEQMPPPATHKKLSAAEKEILARWIAEGAEYRAALVVHRAGEAGRCRRCKTRAGPATRSTSSCWRGSKPRG